MSGESLGLVKKFVSLPVEYEKINYAAYVANERVSFVFKCDPALIKINQPLVFCIKGLIKSYAGFALRSPFQMRFILIKIRGMNLKFLSSLCDNVASFFKFFQIFEM